MVEHDRGHDTPITGELGVPLATVRFSVPGVGHGDFDRKGRVLDRLKRNKVAETLVEAGKESKHSRRSINWDHVAKLVEDGKHKGIFVVTSGMIIVTIGVEVGRHGKDLNQLLRLIKAHQRASSGMKSHVG